MRKKHKKINIFKFILYIIIFIFIINFINNLNITELKVKLFGKNYGYGIIAKNNISQYKEIGQEKIKNQDGYFTTFTTSNKKYKEYKQNGESSWAKNEYWGGTMEENGCGITSMAIILSGYGYDETPEDLRKKYYPVMNYENMEKELENNYNINNSGFSVYQKDFSKNKIIDHLKQDKPILICVMGNYEKNRWTEKSHYMVLLATDGENMVYISNPNGLDNQYNSSGWYNIEEVLPYIAKIMFIESE